MAALAIEGLEVVLAEIDHGLSMGPSDGADQPVDAVVAPELLAPIDEQRHAEQVVLAGALDHAQPDALLRLLIVRRGDAGVPVDTASLGRLAYQVSRLVATGEIQGNR